MLIDPNTAQLNRVLRARVEYQRRLAGTAHPAGGYRAGRGKLWRPNWKETQQCCFIADPLHLYEHCHSLEHVANLYGVDSAELQAGLLALSGEKTR